MKQKVEEEQNNMVYDKCEEEKEGKWWATFKSQKCTIVRDNNAAETRTMNAVNKSFYFHVEYLQYNNKHHFMWLKQVRMRKN